MDYDVLNSEIERIKRKYALIDFNFDTECIYRPGDLTGLLRTIIGTALPEYQCTIAEQLSTDQQQYVATVTAGDSVVVFAVDSWSDWLPDYFFEDLENLPAALHSDKRFYSINPAIGLTGQDAWYFCGPESDLRAARQEGLPLLFPGEDLFDTPEYRQYGSSG